MGNHGHGHPQGALHGEWPLVATDLSDIIKTDLRYVPSSVLEWYTCWILRPEIVNRHLFLTICSDAFWGCQTLLHNWIVIKKKFSDVP
jgi:hypothetical protein